jgi:anthranilate phosphoribosyltransferase
MDAARAVLEHLLDRQDLSADGAAALLQILAQAGTAPVLAGALLTALRAKGVTAPEVRGFAAAMRALARKPDLAGAGGAIDIVGTGGDASGSLNLSTGAAFLTAACGLPVIKHGNRSISSRSGSADVIERLGFTLPLGAAAAARCFAETGFTFLFAPYYHPAMKSLAPVRAALGIRTVFNLLGPLTNPAEPGFRLIGAYDAAAAELIAQSLAGTEIERAWVVHGAAGWDEVTPIGPFLAFDVTRRGVRRLSFDPADIGMRRCEPADLAGGDPDANFAALCAVFAGHDRGPHLAALTLQAGLALHVGGRAGSIADGVSMARATVESGRAQSWLERLRGFAAACLPEESLP